MNIKFTSLFGLVITVVSLELVGVFNTVKIIPNPDTNYSQSIKDIGKIPVLISRKDIETSGYQSELIDFGDDCESGGLANMCCPYWNVTITFTWSGPAFSCTTGGEFKCKESNPDGSCGKQLDPGE